jgi:hypothetical protein
MKSRYFPMNITTVHQKRLRPNLVLLVSLYVAELTAPAVLLSLYRANSKADLVSFLFSRSGTIFAIGILGFALASAVNIHQFRKDMRTGSLRSYFLTLAMNLVGVLLIVGTGELVVRLLSVKKPSGTTLGRKLLYPREWHDVAEYQLRALRKAAVQGSFMVFDSDLGWTIGSNRSSENGLYLSSVEGLRSPKKGIALADQSASCRIALMGDSFTFAEDVPFEDSWGYQLELALGHKCQVLNFGVPGYGVDQAYLRFMKDVRSWNPDVVVLAFVNHDVVRSMAVYGFLLFPDGAMPFPKPRFVLTSDRLSIVNFPLPEPEDIFSKTSIGGLPFITYDIQYDETEWDRPLWRPYYRSYIFRFLISVHPPWKLEREHVSDQALKSINEEIFRLFLRESRSGGSIPIIAFLPGPIDLPPSPKYVPVGLKILRDAGLPHVDLRSCLSQEPFSQYFMPRAQGGHYSPEGNRQIARCLRDVVAPQLAEREKASRP